MFHCIDTQNALLRKKCLVGKNIGVLILIFKLLPRTVVLYMWALGTYPDSDNCNLDKFWVTDIGDKRKKMRKKRFKLKYVIVIGIEMVFLITKER